MTTFTATVTTITDAPATWPPKTLDLVLLLMEKGMVLRRADGLSLACAGGLYRGAQWMIAPHHCSGADGCCQDEVAS